MSKLKEIIHQYVVEALQEILDESYEPEAKQISEARRLIKSYGRAKVYYNPESKEHEVDFFDKNGKNLGEGPRYYTDDREDAHRTAQTQLKHMTKVEESVNQIDELSLDTLEKYKRAAGKRLRSLSPQYNWSPDSPVKKEIDKRVKGYRQAWQKIEDKV